MKLKPTLWRTCRVLANRRRLRLLGALIKKPGQCVREVALRVDIPDEVASKYLRDLNARGLLRAVRAASSVLYYPDADSSVPQAHELLREIKKVYQRHEDPIETIFHYATAFTHPRRIQIVAGLSSGMKTPADLRGLLGISAPALVRHLRKLRSRGLVNREGRMYSLETEVPGLANVLMRLAVME